MRWSSLAGQLQGPPLCFRAVGGGCMQPRQFLAWDSALSSSENTIHQLYLCVERRCAFPATYSRVVALTFVLFVRNSTFWINRQRVSHHRPSDRSRKRLRGKQVGGRNLTAQGCRRTRCSCDDCTSWPTLWRPSPGRMERDRMGPRHRAQRTGTRRVAIQGRGKPFIIFSSSRLF